MKPTPFDAIYTNIKTVPSRSICQIVLEIPIERMQEFVEAFGGPIPGETKWCAIARLDLAKASDEPEKPEKLRQKWESLPMPQQAAMRCAEVPFQRFLREQRAVPSDQPAAEAVRLICGVTSRGDIGKTERSGKAWRDLDGEYQYWLRAYA